MSHRIRLGPPWELETPEGGRERHLRRFGRPRTLDATERVILTADLPEGSEVFLNGEPIELGTDLAARLLPRNELAIATPAGTVPANVALEIHAVTS